MRFTCPSPHPEFLHVVHRWYYRSGGKVTHTLWMLPDVFVLWHTVCSPKTQTQTQTLLPIASFKIGNYYSISPISQFVCFSNCPEEKHNHKVKSWQTGELEKVFSTSSVIYLWWSTLRGVRVVNMLLGNLTVLWQTFNHPHIWVHFFENFRME